MSPNPAQLIPYPISRGPGAGACVGDGVSGRRLDQLGSGVSASSERWLQEEGKRAIVQRASGKLTRCAKGATMKNGCCAIVLQYLEREAFMHGPAALAWRKKIM